MSRPEQTIAFRAYFQGTDLLGVATIEMPQVQFITETISGSGVAGEYESPALGMTQSMSAKLSWVSQTKNFYKLLDSTLPPLLELRASVQQEDEATGVRRPVPLLVTLLANTKASPLGSLETGKKHGNEVEMEITRLEVLLDGQEKLMIDKLAFIYRVNGNDLLRQVRAQTGLNA